MAKRTRSDQQPSRAVCACLATFLLCACVSATKHKATVDELAKAKSDLIELRKTSNSLRAELVQARRELVTARDRVTAYGKAVDGTLVEEYAQQQEALRAAQAEVVRLTALYQRLYGSAQQCEGSARALQMRIEELSGQVAVAASGPAPLPAPLPARAVIESRIDGEFEGWDGETVFKLQNGQIWQQSSYSYKYHYAYSPEVLIYRSGSGYKMRVEGVDGEISVQQLR